MGYFHLKREIKNKIQLDSDQLDIGSIEELISKNIVNSDDEKEPDPIYFKSSELSEVAKIVFELINEDIEETKRDFNPKDFSSKYFLWIKSPIVQMMSFSCELENQEGGQLIYDVVRIIKIQGYYCLILPEDD